MSVNIIIFGIVFVIVLLACLLFDIAALLIWAPSVLVGTLKTVTVVACIVGGCILLIPIIFLFIVSITAKVVSIKAKRKNT